MPNPLKELQSYGQSVWLDYIRRSLITSGELARLIADDGLRGLTSNPAIFEKAMAGSSDYEGALKQLEGRKDLDAKVRYIGPTGGELPGLVSHWPAARPGGPDHANP